MRTWQHVAYFAVAVVLVTPGMASGQSFQGGLRGAVKDAQGIVPGLTVTLVNEATNVSLDTVTNSRTFQLMARYSF